MEIKTNFRLVFFTTLRVVTTIIIIIIINSFFSSVFAQKVVSSEASFASYFVDTTGNLYVTGFDQYSQMVINSSQTSTNQTAQDLVPVKVDFPAGVTHWQEIAAGLSHTLALGDDGNLYAWGANKYGQLGNGTTVNDSLPTLVTKPAGVTNWTEIAAGAFHSYALCDDGNIYAWGFNSFGQLGDGTSDGGNSATDAHPTPTAITKPAGVTSWKSISAGNNFGLAIADNDSLYGWGRNVNAQLGIGNTTDQTVPVAAGVPLLSGVTKYTKVYGGGFFTLALGDDGNLYAWGQNANGQLGAGAIGTGNMSSPQKVELPTGVTSWTGVASCGERFVLAVGDDGNLYGWGQNGNGQLGDGSTTSYNTPTLCAALPIGITAESVASGRNHSIIVDQNNHFWTWGRNTEGQLGNNSTNHSSTPVYVTELNGPLPLEPISRPGIFSSAQTNSSYYIDNDGVLYAWGNNQYGELGIGSTTNTTLPTKVDFPAGVTKWMSVAAGQYHTLIIGNDGNLYSCGRNNYGQLGEGTTNDDSTLIKISLPAGVSNWVIAAAGGGHSLALGSDGNIYGWGYNNFGQVGDSTTTNSSLPLKLKNLPAGVKSWKSVAATNNCGFAVGDDDSLYAWGRNGNGQLGDGTNVNSLVPVKVNLSAGLTVTQMAPGNYFFAALCSDGNIYAWGQGNNGQMGDGTTSGDGTIGSGNYGIPVMANKPAGVTSWKMITTGASFVLALADNDSLYGWGYGGTGELGNGTTTSNNPFPISVSLPVGVKVKELTAGHNHGIVVSEDGKFYSWGRNNEGQLGNGTTTNSPTPMLAKTPGGPLIEPIFSPGLAGSTQGNCSYYIDQNGILYDWGKNGNGQLGIGTTSNIDRPVKVPMPAGVTKWLSVSGGKNHTLALADDGNLYAWGRDNHGQLGDSTITTDQSTPVKVTMPEGVTGWAMGAAGSEHNIALSTDGAIYGWGYNNFGQVGDTTTNDAPIPVKLAVLPAGVNTWKTIGASDNADYAIGNDDVFYAWGRNGNQQLGDSSYVDSNVPVKVQLPAGVKVTKMAPGAYSIAVLCDDGNIYTWGKGTYGQLGYDNTNDSGVPTTVTNPSGITSWKKITGGAHFILAIGNNDSLYAWGRNNKGQIGIGTTDDQTIPVAVHMPSGVKVEDFACGYDHSMILGSDGNFYSWGNNAQGQLGSGSNASNVTVPTLFAGPGILPASPVLFTPANGDSLSAADTLFTWQSLFAADNYNLQIASDNGFSTTIIDTTLTDTTFILSYSKQMKLNPSTEYYWRVKGTNGSGDGNYSETWSFKTPIATGVENLEGIPTVYSLDQNYPNPFNPNTVINYSIPQSGFVTLKVYNILGQEVVTLINGFQKAAYYKVDFDASRLASGVYIYRLRANGFSQSKKMLLVK